MKNYSKKDLAIVGMSGRFPQSKNIDELWQHLLGGELLTKFYSDEELLELGVEKHILEDENYVRVTSLLEGAENFDYGFFGYTQDEGKVIDPQTRVMHEQVWLALEDANLANATDKQIGLFLSARDNPEWRSYSMIKNNPKVNPFFGSKLSNKNYMSTLVSYSLNLKGPSYFIDTGSSSAMVGIHLACRSLLMQECSIAIAGGASISSKNTYGYRYSEAMIYSKDGHCRAFDAKSSGTVPGEGAGAVVLKRLGQAIKDNDRIYAVIKASAVNNDGNRKAGYTTPSVQGQYECIKMAHQVAGVKPNEIAYVEAHGTGTEVGDPIEMKALNKAFASDDKTHQCAIGSVKTNLGHLDKAAGVVGLIKTALALKNKVIPASLNFDTPNPEIDFNDGPFFVNTALKKWEQPKEGLRYAGLSSFGLGGTNGHAVLSEFVQEEPVSSTSRPYQLLTYSAKTQSSLEKYGAKLHASLQNNDTEALADVVYTQNIGRKDFEYRRFVVGTTKEGCIAQLAQEQQSVLTPIVENVYRNVVFMFPGQGSQYYQMAADLYQQEASFKEIMDLGFALLNKETGKNFKEIIGYEGTADKALINDTQYTQPLTFLVEYALAKLLMKWGVQPGMMLGHSLGEYVAACISGVFTFEDALRLVLKRGELMGDLEKGSMVAIAAPVADIESLLTDGLSVAAINATDSCVISGATKMIDGFVLVLEEKGIEFSKLKTSHAFHSEMMDDMVADFEKELDKISFSAPTIPFKSNLTGKNITDAEAMSSEYWLKHLRETVNFLGCLQKVVGDDAAIFVEVGPGSTLTNFLKQYKAGEVVSSATLLSRATTQANDNETLAQGLGKLWSLGVQIDWNAYYEGESRVKVALPTYAFEPSNFPVKAEPIDKIPTLFNNNKRRKLYEWFYEPSWQKQSLYTIATQEATTVKNFLLFTNNNELATALKTVLQQANHTVVVAQAGAQFKKVDDALFEINFTAEEDYQSLFTALAAANITDVVYFVGEASAEANEQQPFYDVLNITKQLQVNESEEMTRLSVVTNSLYEITGVEELNTFSALAAGLVPVIHQESPLINTQTIDVLPHEHGEKHAKYLYRELVSDSKDKVVALRGKNRWIKTYNDITLDSVQANESKIKEKGVYLITGGLGNLGFEYAKYLIEQYQASLIIVGRTAINSDEANKQNRLHELQALGNVCYKEANVADLNAMQTAIDEGEAMYGKIQGVIHAAGIIEGLSFTQIDALEQKHCEIQFDAKVRGVRVLEALFANKELDFCLLVSSLNSMIGGHALAAYAAANVYMDIFVQQTSLPNCSCVNYDKLNFFGKTNNFSISKDEMVEVLEHVLRFEDSAQTIVSIDNLQEKIDKWLYPSLEEESQIEKADIERSMLTSVFAAPETETEVQLINLFQEFFGFSNIGIDDDFFEIGVDSLKGVMLKNQIHKEFGIMVSLVSLFEHNTVHKLAELLDRSYAPQVEETDNSIVI